MKPNYYLTIDTAERRLIIGGLNNLQSRFIAAGQFTDVVDELLLKYILGKFKFEGKYLDYDLDGARQLLEKSYSNGLIKAGLYLCEFVYPKYSSSLNYGEKRLKMLNDISQNSNIKVSNYAKFLLQNCYSTTI